jgi:hypothetical protein
LNLALAPQTITHRKHFSSSHQRYFKRFIQKRKQKNDFVLPWQPNHFLFCFVFFLTGELEEQQVDGGGPVPSKSCGGCVLVKKGEEPSETNRKIGNTPFPLDDQLKKRGKKGVSQTSSFFFYSFLFFFRVLPTTWKAQQMLLYRDHPHNPPNPTL